MNDEDSDNNCKGQCGYTVFCREYMLLKEKAQREKALLKVRMQELIVSHDSYEKRKKQ
jgi:hypothetical protein